MSFRLPTLVWPHYNQLDICWKHHAVHHITPVLKLFVYVAHNVFNLILILYMKPDILSGEKGNADE